MTRGREAAKAQAGGALSRDWRERRCCLSGGGSRPAACGMDSDDRRLAMTPGNATKKEEGGTNVVACGAIAGALAAGRTS